MFLTSHFFDQTKYKEIPIKTNIAVHVGAKIQLGGLKLGLFKFLYQEPIDDVVKKEPMAPANSQIIMLVKNFIGLLKFIYYICSLLAILRTLLRAFQTNTI